MTKKEKEEDLPLSRSPFPQEMKGFLILAASLLLALSLLSFEDGQHSRNWLGLMGYSVAWALLYLFGLGSFFFVLFTGWIGWSLLSNRPIRHMGSTSFYFSVFLLSFALLSNLVAETQPSLAEILGRLTYSEKVRVEIPISYTTVRYYLGGVPLYFLYQDIPRFNLEHLLSNTGIGLISTILLFVSFVLLTNFPVLKTLSAFKKRFAKKSSSETVKIVQEEVQREPRWQLVWQKIRLRLKKKPKTLPSHPVEAKEIEQKEEETWPDSPFYSPRDPVSEKPSKIEKSTRPSLPSPAPNRAPPPADEAYDAALKRYILPASHLLQAAKKENLSALKKELRKQAEVLEETLLSFGIEAKVGEIQCGPTITSFEIHPAVGVKVQKITALANDIALNMQAESIRIVAPIPGKAAVGIEIPNPVPQEVNFRELLSHYQKGSHSFKVPILLGKTVDGTHLVADLTKMPHCIIAGATGSGKSVCINTIVMSLLMMHSPEQVQILMVDPKKVELTPYSELPHLLSPVITEPQDACMALNWLVREMETRYEILKHLSVRNIDAFNQRSVNEEWEANAPVEIPSRLPYIVGIIDEFADLMMVASQDIESPIARIAQMARAVGIHLILATQRPSREVITGLIKANFPTRIAFKVASRVNSQIILDEAGAETLLGNGDMLYLGPGTSTLLRAQGVFIRDADIHKVIDTISRQLPPRYRIPSFSQLQHSASEGLDEAVDTLFHDAKELVISTGNASTTFLQRKLKIGYARAASLIDELEERGIVSPPEGSKGRKVLVNKPSDLNE